MDVTLRVSGKSLRLAEAAALISVAPYRIDRAGERRYTVNCLHWLVASLDGDSFSKMMQRASYRLDHRVVEAATAIGASVTLSVYRTDEEADRPDA